MVMSDDSEEVVALRAKVKHLQEQLSKIGQPKKPSQKERNAALKSDEGAANKPKEAEKAEVQGSGGSQAQKTAKGKADSSSGASSGGAGSEKQKQQGAQNAANAADKDPKSLLKHTVADSGKRLTFFDHLPKMKKMDLTSEVDGDKSLHPSILQLGSMYRVGLIQEDDDRVASLLVAFCNVIRDYKTPPNKSLNWDLDKYIRNQVQHLVDCRPLCVGMGNLIKQLRHFISQSPPDANEADAKALIVDKLHNFFEDRMQYAEESIGNLVADVIHHDDVILTYGSSPLIRKTLVAAAAEKNFRLIVVDSRPLNSGLATLRVMSNYMPCIYTTLSGVASVMKEATRVLLGASALFSNGSMQAPCGTAMIASLAKAQSVPVIAVCESYKFSERVQLDSIVSNELGCPHEICVPVSEELRAEISGGSDGAKTGGASSTAPQLNCEYLGGSGPDDHSLPFQVLNPRYDLTPIENISAVATETGLIPPTSVPVLIRELKDDSM